MYLCLVYKDDSAGDQELQIVSLGIHGHRPEEARHTVLMACRTNEVPSEV